LDLGTWNSARKLTAPYELINHRPSTPHELTRREKEEVKNLLLSPAVKVVPVEERDDNRTNLRTALRKRKAEEPDTYIDCDFI